jgi:uncharacterized Zn-finger protein
MVNNDNKNAKFSIHGDSIIKSHEGEQSISKKNKISVFNCDISSKCYTRKDNLKRHRKKHFGYKGMDCPFCGKKIY